MSELQKPIYPPASLADSGMDDWLFRVRNAVSADGNALAYGPNSSILARSIHPPHDFMPIMLPGGGTAFINDVERDKAFALLVTHGK